MLAGDTSARVRLLHCDQHGSHASEQFVAVHVETIVQNEFGLSQLLLFATNTFLIRIHIKAFAIKLDVKELIKLIRFTFLCLL